MIDVYLVIFKVYFKNNKVKCKLNAKLPDKEVENPSLLVPNE
jgi:hypothetical protein